jgi:hypothetical protein
MSRYEPFRAPLTLRDAVDRLFQESFVAPNVLRHEGHTPQWICTRPPMRT